ncbi:MAG TPA: anti-sigma factor [Candidatus Limnocylindrales bacterium]|nr:anti-sigma factor [Candidatus Limnocylindrales bacterium]
MTGSDPIQDMTCDEIREVAGAFVLGALPAAEADAVRAHLDSCEDAHAEIRDLGGVLPVLNASVPIVEPSPGLKSRLMAAAAADLAARQADDPVGVGAASVTGTSVSPATSVAATPVAATPVAASPVAPGLVAPGLEAAGPVAAGPVAGAPVAAPSEAAAPTPFPPADEREARRSRTSAGTWLVRIAAVLAIVLLGGWNLLLQGQLNAANTYEQSVAAVLDVAAQPGATTVVLTTAGGTGGSGLAAISSSGQVTMAMQDLAPTTGSTVYTAWVIAGDGVPVPLGDFTVGAGGTGTLEANGAPSTPGVVLALTLEPQSGATTPTLPIISKGVATGAG